MTNYAEMSDDELNRLVAERRGYRFEHFKTHVGQKWFRVSSPDGSPVIRNTAYSHNNEWPEYELEETYEDCADDLNAAAALDFGDIDITIATDKARGIVNVWADDPRDEYHQDLLFNIEAPTMPRAITIAWLMYQDAIGGQG